MNSCPNCGGELLFDPGSGKLKCGFCESMFDPTEIGAGKGAEEETLTAEQAAYMGEGSAKEEHQGDGKEFDVTQYSCPQCGGSIYSTDESVTGFCSYCGASLVLNSRMSKMKMPEKIIPFRITKEQCKEKYRAHVGKFLFAPAEYKDPEYLERFRGIYMPYWVYNTGFNGPLVLPANRSHRQGDYIITENYHCVGQVESYYRGISYDASSSFDDHYSRQIAPFDAHTLVDFNTNYLSGYYADMQDVKPAVYKSEVLDFAKNQIYDSFIKEPEFRGVTMGDSAKNRVKPQLEAEGAVSAFFPVWFLSFRNRDRVAYAVVNGQTGKICGDIPIDKKRFILYALIFSVLSYLALLIVPAMTPKVLLVVASAIAIVCLSLLLSTLDKIVRRDKRLDDKGYLSLYNREQYSETVARQEKKKARKEQKPDPNAVAKKAETPGGRTIVTLIIIALSLLPNVIGYFSGTLETNLVFAAEAVIMLIVGLIAMAKSNYLPKKTMGIKAGIFIMLVVMIYNLFINMLMVAGDWYYYGGAFALMVSIILLQFMTVDQYNLLATRPLPQLNRKGGDDSAR
ncbi:MAG: hypothetical protein IKI75_00515 [Lachnospiraceae bacterium]|nr:hypothetical protein [Lachnospiraceae bacterium]